jgi:hypothetical protein
MEKSKEINYRKQSVPSGPGKEQITVVGQESMKGGSPFTSEMPKKYVVPDGSSKKSDKK